MLKELKDNLIVATIITGLVPSHLPVMLVPMNLTDLLIPFKQLQFPVTITQRNYQEVARPNFRIKKYELTYERNVLLHVGLSRERDPTIFAFYSLINSFLMTLR